MTDGATDRRTRYGMAFADEMATTPPTAAPFKQPAASTGEARRGTKLRGWR
jgi:hypothetical protein